MPESGLLVAAVDQGSSSTKGAVLADDGRCLAEASIPVGTTSSGASVYHDPEELAGSVEEVLGRLLSRHQVDAIGVTCQRSTCLVWERDSGRPLTPALSWQDTSQASRIEGLEPHADEIREKTGLRLSPHYAAAKLGALVESLEDGRRRAESGELVTGTLDAFLMQRLIGRAVTEPGHAGRTLLFDLASRGWSAELAELFGVPLASLPEIATSAARHGSFRDVPVTASAGDQQAALLGHGGWAGGVTAVHFGTGAFVLASTGERLVRDPGLLSAVLASTPQGISHQIEATVNSAGSAVDWASRLVGEDLESWRDRELDPDAVPWVLPAFRGVGAPWWRPETRAAIARLSLESDGSDLLAGTVVGVAMRVLDCVELVQKTESLSILRASGKLTRLAGLTGLLADAGQIPVETTAEEEVGLHGIARLAATGLLGGEEPLRRAPPRVSRREPAWSVERARSLRERWKDFATAASRLAPGT